MNNVEILKEIGLNEVSRRTHIDAKYLEHIINKDFDKLTRLNTKGFTKILQREYNIDFTAWLEEYHKFINEHKDQGHSRIVVEPTISAYRSTPKNSHGFLFGIILLAIAALGIWFFELHKYLDELPKIFSDKNQSVSYSDSTTVQVAQQNLLIIQQENNLTSQSSDEPNATTPNIDGVPVLSQNDVNLTTENIPTQTITQNSDLNASLAGSFELDLKNSKEIKIIPKKKVWLGIVDLDADKKRSLNSDSAITVELKARQLIVAGHGEITLQAANESKKFSSDNPIRFLVQNGKIKQISTEEFVGLNKGKAW